MNLTKEEYKILLKLVYLGNWIIEEGNEEPDDYSPENKLEQKLLAMAKDNDCIEDVDLDEETNFIGYSEQFEESTGIFEIIDDYNEEILYDELGAHFARKEFVNKNKDKLDKISDSEAEEAISVLVEKYLKYFSEHGLEELKLNNA